MTRQEAISYLSSISAAYVTYGIEGSDLGTPVERQDAVLDIQSMSDDDWADGDIFGCDENGTVTE